MSNAMENIQDIIVNKKETTKLHVVSFFSRVFEWNNNSATLGETVTEAFWRFEVLTCLDIKEVFANGGQIKVGALITAGWLINIRL